MTANEQPRVLVVGAGGLVGGELLRLLSLHPRLGPITALSKSQAGRAAHESHRALLHLPGLEMIDRPAAAAAREADVVFCALPHGQSQAVMAALFEADPQLVVDLAADFRLRDPELFAQHYGPHGCPELLDRFVYGLPELNGEAVRDCRAVANPGCFATAAELLLLPLARRGLLPETTPVFAVTGSSGAGALPKATTHHPFRANNFFAYKMLAHQHEPEIDQTLADAGGRPRRIRLLAHSGPFVRGIHAAAYLADEAFAATDVAALYRESYGDRCPFVAVLDRPPQVAEVAATNHVHVQVTQRGKEVAVALALDNLVKGAAGQAIQNMNLALGFPETAGLTHPGAFPC